MRTLLILVCVLGCGPAYRAVPTADQPCCIELPAANVLEIWCTSYGLVWSGPYTSAYRSDASGTASPAGECTAYVLHASCDECGAPYVVCPDREGLCQ